MKKLHNFLNLYALNQKRFKRWYISTIITLSILALYISYQQVPQLYIYYALKQEHQILDTFIKSQRAAVKKKKKYMQEIQNIHSHIDSLYKKNTYSFSHIIKSIADFAPENLQLIDFNFDKKKQLVTFKGLSKSYTDLTIFINKLLKHQKFYNVRLMQVATKKKGLDILTFKVAFNYFK